MKLPILLSIAFIAASASAQTINKASGPITIDGVIDEPSWKEEVWRPMNALILGEQPPEDDFSGRFKLLWDEQYLYLHAEIVDDVLFDQHPDPLLSYWDDDCLEIFVDEDASGGEHQFNFNAFAYHIALDNQAVDIGYQKADGSPDFLLLNEHIQSAWKRSADAPRAINWEVAISLYDDSFTYSDSGFVGEPVSLKKGKQIGFMLAYCDNDGSKHREHFVGSTEIAPVNGDKNLGYKTSSVFEKMTLVD